MMDWNLFTPRNGIGDKHVIPDQDLIEHSISRTCWCNPHEDEEHFGSRWIHHSADGRESYQEGRKLQ